jgi:tetratricopeptide (TPR) repeat protein
VREEAARRLTEGTVDPVPGLAAIRGDVLAVLTNVPEAGFEAAVRMATRARDLEREALDRELQGADLDAVAVYENALELNPNDGSIRRSLATLRSRMGIEYSNRQQFTAAHANLREAVETDTTFAQGFANLGTLLAMNEEFEYALSVSHEASDLEPDNDLFQLQIGRIWKQRGYLDRAIPYYEKAMALNPQSVEAAIGYIDTKLAMESDAPDLKAGLEFLRGYLKIDPDHTDLKFRILRLENAIAGRLTRPEDGDAIAGSAAGDEGGGGAP